MTSLKKETTLIGGFIPDQLQVTELGRHLIILRSLQKVSVVVQWIDHSECVQVRWYKLAFAPIRTQSHRSIPPTALPPSFHPSPLPCPYSSLLTRLATVPTWEADRRGVRQTNGELCRQANRLRWTDGGTSRRNLIHLCSPTCPLTFFQTADPFLSFQGPTFSLKPPRGGEGIVSASWAGF